MMQTKSLVGCSAVRLRVYPNWTDDNEEEEITSETRLKYEKIYEIYFLWYFIILVFTALWAIKKDIAAFTKNIWYWLMMPKCYQKYWSYEVKVISVPIFVKCWKGRHFFVFYCHIYFIDFLILFCFADFFPGKSIKYHENQCQEW